MKDSIELVFPPTYEMLPDETSSQSPLLVDASLHLQDAHQMEEVSSSPKRRRGYRITVGTIALVLTITIFITITLLLLQPSTSEPSQSWCQSPSVRREWRTLSVQEKQAYLDAVSCLRARPSRLGLNQSLYEDFPYFHTRKGEEGMAIQSR